MTQTTDNRVSIALSIAGSDSSAGAGIQADIKSAAALGVYMASAITAITAQNSCGVDAVDIISTEMVRSQIDAVASDMRVEAIKTGMIPNVAIVDAVIDAIERYNIKNIVVDPVMVSTSGATLIDTVAISKIIDKLFPISTIITPNSVECSYITGYKIDSYSSFDKAAQKFEPLGAEFLLLKGGHIDSTKTLDILYDFKNGDSYRYEFSRVDSPNTHGTGCSLSSSIAAMLAIGESVEQSVLIAEEFVHSAIESAKELKYGAGFGAISHFKMDRSWKKR